MFVIWAMTLSCAASLPKVKDVTQLSPPREVSLARSGGQLQLHWRASVHENREGFVGYNIYISPKSLIFAPVVALPEPVLILKKQGDYEYTLDNNSAGSTLFFHVRSLDKNGDISLPSLPELLHTP
jgi:hypothetical protein